MSTGWRCPGCSRCYAPWVTMCRECGEPETSGNRTPAPGVPRKQREQTPAPPPAWNPTVIHYPWGRDPDVWRRLQEWTC